MRHMVIVSLCLTMLAACEPSDSRPGLWLSGEAEESFPADWSFSDQHDEIYLEVATPYLLPHSVTIWCADVDGTLYVGARDPESKNWPGWVDDDPDVRLKIGERIFPVHLEPLTDPAEVETVSAAYSEKYALAGGLSGGDAEVSQRYWRVTPPA